MNELKVDEFLDEAERRWSLRLTAGAAMKLRDEFGLDVDKILDGTDQFYKRMISETWLIVDVIVFLTADRRKEKGIDDEAFLATCGGPVLSEAMKAFNGAIGDILPPLKARAFRAMVKQVEAGLEVAGEAIERNVEKRDMTKITDLVDRAFDEADTST